MIDATSVEFTWPEPDMTVLNAGRRPPVPMPGELFGPVWPLLEAIAEGTASPVDYSAMAFLAACASLIGNKRRIKPYSSSHWSEPAILWCCVVGDPSSRKSPALESVIAPLRTIEGNLADKHKETLRLWMLEAEQANAIKAQWELSVHHAVKNQKAPPPMPEGSLVPDEPVRQRTLVTDVTPEALAVILAGNPAGVLHFRDELPGWLKSFERYSPGGREFWLEAYGGRPFAIDRKGSREAIIIPFNGVSVLGGIQPIKLAEAIFAADDDGLIARIIFAWPERRKFSRPSLPADMSLLERIYQRLTDLEFGTDEVGRNVAITIPLAEDAADIFDLWQQGNENIDEDAGSLFKSFVGKMNGTVLRLALVSELVHWAIGDDSEPTEISVSSVIAACAWVNTYAKPTAERAYGDAVVPAVERGAALLARYIRKGRLNLINKRELKRSPHKSPLASLQKGNAMDAAIERLIDAGWLAQFFNRDGTTNGRTRLDYVVNPAVHHDK